MLGIAFAIKGAACQGVLWSIMTLGLYITFKVLDFADMTVDGSFALGGAVVAVLLLHNINVWLCLPIVFIVGTLSGLVTGLLHTKLEIPGILAGILSMIALYSINIRIMSKANIPFLGIPTLITHTATFLHLKGDSASLLVGILLSGLAIIVLYWFFGTEIGSAIRATGNNARMARALGVDTDAMKILALMIANGFVALSGALVAQSQGYADVGMGTGTIVIGLASIIIGECVFGNKIGFWYCLLSVVFGSIIYRIVIAFVLQLGLKSSDLKLLTALSVALALSVPVLKRHFPHKNTRGI